MHDADLAAAQDPYTPPARLADIAARRGDLHPLLLSHPACYPELRQWIAQVNSGGAGYPVSMSASPVTAPPHAAPRRNRAGCFLIGCAGLALAAFAVVGVIVIGAVLSSPDGGSVAAPTAGGPAPGDARAAFDAERARFYELAAQLEGNPVAPLVTRVAEFERLETSIASPNITDAYAAELTQRAQTAREELEQRIADAAARRANASGSVTEGIVDEAGAGFIDIAWDAETACAASQNGGRFTAGCVSEDPVAVHLAPEAQLPGDPGMRVVVLHELTHLYQRADSDAHRDGVSAATQLIEQGYFQGSSEVMADCYALTYLNLRTLTFENRTMGYGYVCGDDERRVIREWAAQVDAPMP